MKRPRLSFTLIEEYRMQNNVFTLHILEIDSSIVKNVELHFGSAPNFFESL
jgi:hypothetical protein